MQHFSIFSVYNRRINASHGTRHPPYYAFITNYYTHEKRKIFYDGHGGRMRNRTQCVPAYQ